VTAHVVGVAGVVRDAEARILLVRTDHAGWELPGGRVERGEDLVAALEREVLEESGCEVQVGRLAGISSSLGASDVLILTFECRHVGGEARAGDDSLDAGWFSAEEALGLITHPGERARLTDALGGGVWYRAVRHETAGEYESSPESTGGGEGDPEHGKGRDPTMVQAHRC